MIESIVLYCLANPAVRKFLEDVVVRVFADVFVRAKMDPVFDHNFTLLAQRLADPSLTTEARQSVLKQIDSLRSSSTP